MDNTIASYIVETIYSSHYMMFCVSFVGV